MSEHLGIDLGPLTRAKDQPTPPAPPLKRLPPVRTLTVRLAEAAAYREHLGSATTSRRR